MNDQKYEELKTILKLILVKTPIAEYPDFFTKLILEVAFDEWEIRGGYPNQIKTVQ